MQAGQERNKKRNVAGHPVGQGRPEKWRKLEKPENLEKLRKPEKLEKLGKLEKPENLEKFRKPEKPANLEKPEKLEKPAEDVGQGRRGHSRQDKEASIRGRIVRELIAQATDTRVLGEKIRSGELRKMAGELEGPWKCPAKYVNTVIGMGDFTMDFLLPVKALRPRVVLQLHGGGYIAMMRNAYRSMAVLYSKAGGGIPVLSVDYRVAPENPYPAALEDALASYDWLLSEGYSAEDIIVAGDSAGGGLALAMCLWLKDHRRKLPRGIIAMSPWTDMTASGESYQSNYELDPLFGRTEDSLLYNRDYLGEEDPKNPYISPVFGNLAGLPPVLIQVGTYEMLLDDSVAIAEKVRKAGGKVKLSCYEGMFHVFQLALRMLPESSKAWDEIKEFFRVLEK